MARPLRSSWTTIVPLARLIVLALTWQASPGPLLAAGIAAVLVGRHPLQS